MKKLLCWTILLLILISSNWTLPINAEEQTETVFAEEKVYCNATLEDEFTNNKVIVVLSNEVSLELGDYTEENFSGINIKAITDLSSSTKNKAIEQWNMIYDAFKNQTTIESEEIVNYQKYNQILCLELEKNSKENVLDVIQVLQQRDDVIYAGPDYEISISSNAPTDPDYVTYQNDYAELIQLPQAWDITTGSDSVIVGVLDTGIDGSHIELSDSINVSLSRDFTNGSTTGSSVSSVTDINGHGTHVAGIIGAQGDNDIGVAGVCWDVTLVSLQVFNQYGNGSLVFLYNAINYADSQNIPILNYSGGGTEEYEDLRQAIENYQGLFVCASGNSGTNNDEEDVFPAIYDLDNLITVGASTLEDERLCDPVTEEGSNYGASTVDLFAPGENVWSTYPGNRIARMSGTSMATPYVTGVAALLLSNYPDLKPCEIKATILSNVDDCGTSFDEECLTNGRLNAYEALSNVVRHRFFCISNDLYTHTYMCNNCDYSYTESHSWINYTTYYRCSVCNVTSTTIPGIMSWEDEEGTE